MQLDPGTRFRLLANAREDKAITMVERALKKGGSISAAIELLGTNPMTLHRAAKAWPRLRKVLDAGKCTSTEAASRAGLASKKARASRTRKPASK